MAKEAAKRVCVSTHYRTNTCGELRLADVGKQVTLAGWVQTCRDKNQIAFLCLRDRWGVTQCVFHRNPPEGEEDEQKAAYRAELYNTVTNLGREYCVQVVGTVGDRGADRSKQMETGDIEVLATELTVLTKSKTPPMKIMDETDAKEELRMKHRYLDIRRNPVKNALLLRSRLAGVIRRILQEQAFVEVETPVLIKSTPEGARDFVVPSRMNKGMFYALPQSPQTFKQILMVAGMDRYFQIVKCFRDEELRADRQPEFTQLDCEMSFVSQEDILSTFETVIRQLFKEGLSLELPTFPRMTWHQAMKEYGIDKPDTRFGMKLVEINDLAKGKGKEPFAPWENSEIIIALRMEGNLVDDELFEPAMKKLKQKCGKKKPPTEQQIAAEKDKCRVAKWSKKKSLKGLEKYSKSDALNLGDGSFLAWVQITSLEKGTFKSSLPSKFYGPDQMKTWAERCGAGDGDTLLILNGQTLHTREACGKLRHHMGDRLGLRSEGFAALWVVDFPLLEWNEDQGRFTAMHHPFCSCKPEDLEKFNNVKKDASGQWINREEILNIRANAYDMVINGTEVGGGSIRIHDRATQFKVFELLAIDEEKAQEQFGFLLDAFQYGAPPHGGLAFGFDRLCQILGGALGLDNSSIRDYIAFPKNNQGRDVMLESPSVLDPEQLTDLAIPPQWVRNLSDKQLGQLKTLWDANQAKSEEKPGEEKSD